MGGEGSTGLIECENKKSILKSFTLAEVLITLTIIGFVAAMTVPILTANHKRIEYATKLKKFYNIINEAIEMAETDFDAPASRWSFDNGSDFFNTYLRDYIKHTRVCTDNSCPVMQGTVNGVAFPIIYLDDGTRFKIFGSPRSIDFDVNGDKGPNEFNSDIYTFNLVTDGNITKVGANPEDELDSRSDLREECANRCSVSSRNTSCLSLIINDGWEFKKDSDPGIGDGQGYPCKL